MVASNDTLVWLADTAALQDSWLARYAGWLGESERQRFGRIARPERRRQFVAGRALLRLALGRLLGVDPAAVLLQERPGQVPALTYPQDPGVGFSISHTGPWVACAASTATAVGLDIERMDSCRDMQALAGQAFGPQAASRLGRLDAAGRAAEFYRMWCEHEAHIKLGQAGGTVYPFTLPGLSGALCCARPLVAAPCMTLVYPDDC